MIKRLPAVAVSAFFAIVLTACQIGSKPPPVNSALATPFPPIAAPVQAPAPETKPTATVVAPVRPTPSTPASPGMAADQNVALLATVTATSGQDTAGNAIDGKLDTLWSAGADAPQSYTLSLDRPYIVSSIQLVVAQTPAGQTTQEIWLGDLSGSLHLYQKLVNTWTADGQTVVIPVQPPQIVDRVLIRTDASPSFVAWHEVRVLGLVPSGSTTASPVLARPTPLVVDWPKVAVVGSFSQPTQITNAGDGSNRLFVVERPGTIRIVKDGTPLSRPFLDITDRVKWSEGEQGLFSVAFPPGFARKPYVYVAYTSMNRGPIGDVIVARYHLSTDPNFADPSSEQVILTIPKLNPDHNGGHLAFGPKDGFLYFGTGDDGLENDPTTGAQSLGSLNGKILRIDPESGAVPYAIPPSNPFVRTPGARPEIWAVGLRNPWQFSFDSRTGDLYVGDVGENNAEEIDFQPAAGTGGENYGWATMEGNNCFAAANCDQRDLTFPIEEYSHQDGNCAVVGGDVYRGSAYPNMQGIYFYGDLCTGRIWGLRQVGGQWESNLLVKEPFQISNIGRDERGNLFVADFSDGAIFMITEPRA